MGKITYKLKIEKLCKFTATFSVAFLLAFVAFRMLTPIEKSSALDCENSTSSNPSSICDTSTTDVNVSIEGSWTISVSSSGTLGLDLTPNSFGTLSTTTDNLNVYTNTPNGYQLYLNSTSGSTDIYNNNVLDENGNLSTNLPSGTNTNHFSATTGTKSSPATLTNNTWGYSLAPSPTTFSKVELTNTSADSLISTGSKTTGAGDNIDITYGFMADTKLTPGTYSTQVTYTAVADVPAYTLSSITPNQLYTNDQTNKQVTIMTSTPASELGLGEITVKITNASSTTTETSSNTVNLTNCTEITNNGYRGAICTFSGNLVYGTYNVELTSSWHNATYTLINGFKMRDYRNMSQITYMQDMNADICNNTATATSTGANIVTLKDSRDQKSYKIAKLADGNCWMNQNLALDGNRTLHPSDSNVTTDRPLSANIANGTASNDTSIQIFSGIANNYTSSCSSSNPYCVTSTEKYGNLYNFMAATAGVGTASSTGTITESICPSATNGETWRLPDNGAASGLKSYSNLASAYDLSPTNITDGTQVQTIQHTPLNFPLAGYYDNSALHQVYASHYWTRTVVLGSTLLVHNLTFISGNGFFHPQTAHAKLQGFSVRCVFGE